MSKASARERMILAEKLYCFDNKITVTDFKRRLREIRDGLLQAQRRGRNIPYAAEILADIQFWFDERAGGSDAGKLIHDEAWKPYFVCQCSRTVASRLDKVEQTKEEDTSRKPLFRVKIDLQGKKGQKGNYPDNVGGRCMQCNRLHCIPYDVLAELLGWTTEEFCSITGLEGLHFEMNVESWTSSESREIKAIHFWENVSDYLVRSDSVYGSSGIDERSSPAFFSATEEADEDEEKYIDPFEEVS